MNFFSNILGASGSNVDYGDTFQGLWESTGFSICSGATS